MNIEIIKKIKSILVASEVPLRVNAIAKEMDVRYETVYLIIKKLESINIVKKVEKKWFWNAINKEYHDKKVNDQSKYIELLENRLFSYKMKYDQKGEL